MVVSTTTFYIILAGAVGILVLFTYILRNLLIKVEKYEDEVENLQKTLEDIQSTIVDSQMHLKSLDERGVFESDDEVGYFFEQMKQVQNELDRFTNAQKKKQS